MEETPDNAPVDIEDADIPRYDEDFFAARRAERHKRSKEAFVRSWIPDREERGSGRRAAVIAAVIAAVLLLPVAADFALAFGKVHPGVVAGGIDVGGRSLPETRRLLTARGPATVREPVTVSHEAERWDLSAESVGAKLDAEASARAAYSVGRSGGLRRRIAARFGAWFGGRPIPLSVECDESALKETVSTISERVAIPPKDASVKVDRTRVELVSAIDGLEVDRDAAADRIRAAFGSERRAIELPVRADKVAVTDRDAQAAAGAARRIVSGPVELSWRKKSWDLQAEKIGGWLAFRKVPWTVRLPAVGTAPSAEETGTPGSERMALQVYVDPDEVAKSIRPISKSVDRPAKDADFEVDDGKVKIVRSKTGLGVDRGALADKLATVLSSEGTRTVELRVKVQQPKVTTEKARSMGIKERLATYTTYYDSSNKPRVSNIHLLADTIDGTLIAPGKTFSFNGTVGPRTAEKGYQEANAIVNGKLVPQLGGGICQFGTTIFNTVFFSGLPVVERKNHSFYISHYPKGRDATVSFGGPDFKFRNDLDEWLLIKTAYSAGSVTVSLYGTDPSYDVSYKTGPFTDPVPFPIEKVKDPTLPVGRQVIEDAGVKGAKIVVTRTVKRKGQVVREDTFVSNYRPKEQVVRVGTKKKAGSKSATGTSGGN